MPSTSTPYPAYRDSGIPWLGDVPEHWEVRPALAAYHPKLVRNVGMVESTVLSLSYGRIIVRPPEKLRGLVPESFETYQVVDPGDIIVRTTDLQNDQTSLRVGLSRHRGIITSAYLCLATTERMTSDFGYQFLNTYDLLKIIYGYGSGLRQNLSFAEIKRMPVLIPPPEEQAAIVRYLDHADRRIRRYIRAKQRLIALLEEQKQAIIHQAVTRGLDPTVPMKPSGVEWLGDIPAHWEVRRLKELAEVRAGLTLGTNYGAAPLTTHPYLRVANVQAGHVDLSDVKEVAVPPAVAGRATLRAGDVLMTEGGDIDKLGRGCVWRAEIPECLHQNHIFAVRCDPKTLLPEFLEAVMASRSGRIYFQRTAKQTTNLAATNRSILRAFPIAMPSVDEQQTILDSMLFQTDALRTGIRVAQSEIDLLREYRTRLIADVVTGKLDVLEAAAHLPDADHEPEPLDDLEAIDELDDGQAEELEAELEEALT